MKRRCPIIFVEQFSATALLTVQAPLWFAFTLFLLWGSLASVAEACMICIPYPQTTLADRLLQSKTVITAREKVEMPYTFNTVEVLKGKMEEGAFGAFINITARRMLKQNRVTAFIETNPDTGVEEIENMYFSNKSRTPDEIEEVCKGLSVLGSEGGFRDATELIARRQRIVASYGTLLENYPLMAGPVAKDLISWRERALVEQLTEINENESALDPDAKMAVTYYLWIAKRF
jgi:hypothetical protein